MNDTSARSADLRALPLSRLADQRLGTDMPQPGAQERAALLQRILSAPAPAAALRVTAPRASRSRPGLRVAATGVALAAATTLGVLVAPVSFPSAHHGSAGIAYAATPPPLRYAATAGLPSDPAALLGQLAMSAQSQPPASGAGRYDYISTRGWYLDASVAADGTTTGQVEATTREQWVAADGSGRIREVRGGQPTDTSDYPAGGLSAPVDLPTDPAALRRELAKSHPPYGTAEWFVAVGDVWNAQVVSPAVQAALLRLLASEPDIAVSGSVTDRAGRSGVAVSTEASFTGLKTRYTLIFDRSTGALLDAEETVLEAGRLPVQAPATTSYTVWMAGAHVAAMGVRP